VARREEWLQQVRLALLLDRWVDSTTTWWSAIDTVARSASSGAMRRKRGCKSGTPDTFVLYRGKLVTIEMKSRRGQCSPSQRLAREALLRAGAQWWVCRSANAAIWALAQSGVPFRTIVHEDGTIERWQQPKLPAWEIPKENPHERRPRAPEWEPEAVSEIAEQAAAASDDAADDDIASLAASSAE
jgi:hypothetical protein